MGELAVSALSGKCISDGHGNCQAPDGISRIALADGVRGDDVVFGELGYAREARASFIDFTRAQQRGDLPSDVRFQVCLPTPFAVVNSFCIPSEAPAIEKAYERAMADEIAQLSARFRTINYAFNGTFAWKWCSGMGKIGEDGRNVPMFPDADFISRPAAYFGVVPADVELGIHPCYGDFEAKHFIEPRDAGKMVEFANALAQAIKHPLAFMHLPVPIDRDDDAFFKPFDALKLDSRTELYLGVVHAKDGVEGTRKRIARQPSTCRSSV